MSETKDAPFIVKSMPEAERQAIIVAARRANQTTAEWLVEATRAYIEAGQAGECPICGSEKPLP